MNPHTNISGRGDFHESPLVALQDDLTLGLIGTTDVSRRRTNSPTLNGEEKA